MACYFFDLPDDLDECGTEIADMGAVRQYALRYCSELMRDTCLGTRGKDYWRVDVRNATGEIVFHVVCELTPNRSAAFDLPGVENAADRRGSGAAVDRAIRDVRTGTSRR